MGHKLTQLMIKIWVDSPFKQGLIIGVSAALISAIIAFSGALDRLDLAINDVRAGASQVSPSSKSVIIAIDEQTTAMLGGYPFSRSYFAKVVDELRKSDANRVYMDISFGAVGPEQQDKLLINAFREFGENRIALPSVTLNKFDSEGNSHPLVINPLDKFLLDTTLVASDLPFARDGRTRAVGLDIDKGNTKMPNAAAWLVHGGKAAGGTTPINFGINLAEIEVFSFIDVLHEKIQPEKFKGKDVIISLTVGGLVRNINVPHYGYLPRPQVFALAAETLRGNLIVEKIDPNQMLVGMLLLALISGVWLRRYNALVGAAVLLTIVLAVNLVAQKLRSDLLLDASTLVAVLSVFLTYFGVQISVNPAFSRFRQAVRTFVEKIDLSHARLLHSGNDAIVTFTPEGKLLTMNAAAEKMFGKVAEECIGRPIAEILPEQAEELLANAAGQQPGRFQAEFGKQSNWSKHVDISYNAMPAEDGWVGLVSIRDITEMKAREERFEHAAFHDALTGLANRAGFSNHLEATTRFCDESQQQFGVLMIDLDKFKEVNDSLGHHVGDGVLTHVSSTLQENLRKSDYAARLGGDEFAVIMAAPVNIENARKLAYALVEKISAPTEIEGETVSVGASIGIAIYGQHANSPDMLLRRADEAMYKVKSSGKNGVAVADIKFA